MTDNKLKLVIGISQGVWNAFGDPATQKLLDPHPNVHVEVVYDEEQFAKLALEADGVLTFNLKIPSQALQQGSRLRWVHSIPAGIDAIATPELLAAEHVAFTASKGPHAPLIAEQLVLLMLSLARHMPALVHAQDACRWGRDEQDNVAQTSTQLLGKTIAILGVGQIGRHLARICKIGFGMKALGMSRTSRDCEFVDEYFDRSNLHEALGEADVVALCVALTPATENIIGKAEFEAMKSTAFIINAGRGGLIDENALIDAMNANIIGGAGLDTVTVEPLPETSPLWGLPNTIITPHSGPFTDNLGGEVVNFFIENIRRFAEDEPLLGIVHRDEGY